MIFAEHLFGGVQKAKRNMNTQTINNNPQIICKRDVARIAREVSSV